ncbi:MAG: putative oxidoreductase [Gammaproteobacteria bacterium]|jgi:putative oxidoreductase
MHPRIELFARLLLSSVFLGSGLSKLASFGGTQEFMQSVGMPATGLLLWGAIAFELLGSLSVLFGFKARIGAALLLIFLIPATLIFHFELGVQEQMIQVMKNAAIGGGLLLVATYGPGPISIDAGRKTRESAA